MVTKEWDQSLKFLTQSNPQSFVSLLLDGATFLRERERELTSRTIHADLVYEVQWGGETILLHVEFQSRRHKKMGRRVWEYNVLLACTTKLPVYSVVLYLIKDGKAIEPPYEQRLGNGELIHHFRFRNLKLWEMDASLLRQPGMEGMLPLLPLTRDGARREVVEEMITDLARVNRQDLWPVGYCIAALVFPENSENIAWLKERFKPLLHLFQESWAYQEMVQEGRKEGLQEGLQKGEQKGLRKGEQKGKQKGLEGLQEACIRYVQKRFPTLADQARQQIRLLSNIDRLQETFNTLLDATTAAEIEEILAHLSTGPQSTQ